MKSVKMNYIKYLQTEFGTQKYIDFKKILYTENDSLVQVLNNNYLSLIKPYRKSKLSVCDIGGGDGYRILNILSFMNNKFHIRFNLDFVEQSKIYCDLFSQKIKGFNNNIDINIHNNLFESIEFHEQYDLLFLIHSIFAFDNGNSVEKLLNLVKNDGNIIVVSNSPDSLLAKIKNKIDIDFNDDRFEIDDLMKILDKHRIKYSNSYFYTEWVIEESLLDENFYTILHWLSLGNYENYKSNRQMDLRDFIIRHSEKYNNLYLFKEKEQVLIIPKA
jgi:hypothetical protein